MSQTKFQKENLKAGQLQRISAATGLDNISESSKIKLITDSLAEDIFIFRDFVNSATDNIFLDTASGTYLDKKGAEEGVSRIINPTISISREDSIIFIETENGKTFGQIFSEPFQLLKGQKLSLSNGVRLTLLEDITFPSDLSYIAISAMITNTASSPVNIQKNTRSTLPEEITQEVYDAKYLNIKFTKPIHIPYAIEDDLDYRQRIKLAKYNNTYGLEGSIVKTLKEVPSLRGYSIYSNSRGTGTVDVGFTTYEMEDNGSDELSNSIRSYLDTYLSTEVLSLGTDLNVFIPKPLQLSLTLTYISEHNMDDAFIINEAFKALKRHYRYSSDNIINLNMVERIMLTSIAELDYINFTSASLHDTSINEIVTFSSPTIRAPKGTFIFFKESDIGIE